MSLFTKLTRYQRAVYWAPGDSSDDFGKPGNNYPAVVLSPVNPLRTVIPIEIGCRWEDCIEEVIGKDNRVQKSCAKVYSDTILRVGGVLWLGTLSQVFDVYADPYDNRGAWEIIKFATLNNLRVTQTLRVAWLGLKGVSYD